MKKETKVFLKVEYPKWFRWFAGVSILGTTLIGFVFMFWMIHNRSYAMFWKVILLFLISLSGIWFYFGIVLYSIFATETHLKNKSFTGRTKIIPWETIVAIQRPRLGIPYDFIYVITSDREKMLLVRSMKNYERLIQLIEERAPNLKREEWKQEK